MALDPEQKDRWLREFHLNGFVLLRNFLPVELVATMHAQLTPLLQAEYDKACQTGFGRGRARLALDVARWGDLLGGPLADERFRQNPVIEELVTALIGEGRWKRGWTNVEAVWHDSDFMAWHSDQKLEDTPDLDGPHETVRVTYNIPLVDYTWANGATEFLPGSHLLPRSFLTRSINDIPHVFPVRLDLRRGDALLRDGNGLHRGAPNLTEEPRAMLDQTYKRVG